MNHFHSLRNNQENYTVAENEEYQTVEPFSVTDIVDWSKKNANESYYFLFYTGIFIILFVVIVCVCVNPKLIVLNEESNSVLSVVAYIAILGVYLGAIYYYTHISIFYFSESWERFTFIGYGAVLFILVVVFGVMGGMKFEKVKKMLNALGPYKKIQEIKRKDQEIRKKEQRIMQKLTNELQDKQTKLQGQQAKILAKKREKQIELQEQKRTLQAVMKEKQIELQKQKRILQAKAREKIQQERANAQPKRTQLQKEILENL